MAVGRAANGSAGGAAGPAAGARGSAGGANGSAGGAAGTASGSAGGATSAGPLGGAGGGTIAAAGSIGASGMGASAAGIGPGAGPNGSGAGSGSANAKGLPNTIPAVKPAAIVAVTTFRILRCGMRTPPSQSCDQSRTARGPANAVEGFPNPDSCPENDAELLCSSGRGVECYFLLVTWTFSEQAANGRHGAQRDGHCCGGRRDHQRRAALFIEQPAEKRTGHD